MTDAPTVSMSPAGSTLAQRATEALLALAARASQQKSANEIAAIANACKRAEDTCAELQIVAETATEFAKRGVPYSLPALSQAASRVPATLRAAATRALDLEEDLTGRLRGDGVQKALKAAETLIKQSKQALQQAAEDERRRVMPQGSDRLISSMPGNESIQVTARKIQATLQQSASAHIADLPSAIDRWRDAASRWEELSRELDRAVAALPPEIKAFVEAAASEHGAAWSLLTPSVREWLDTDDHGEGYTVRKW